MNKHYEVQYKGAQEERFIYAVNLEENKIRLHASPLDTSWSKPGQLLAFLEDTGNGLKIRVGSLYLDLTYFEAEQIRILLKLNDPHTKLFEVTKKAVK